LLGTEPVQRDEIEKGTTIILLNTVAAGFLILPITIAALCYGVLRTYNGLSIGCISLDMSISLVVWYFTFSGFVVFPTITFYGLFYTLAVSKWLTFIRLISEFTVASIHQFILTHTNFNCRWKHGITAAQRLKNMHAYRCLQILNSIFIDLTKPIVALMMGGLAIHLITILFVLLRGGISDYSTEINAFAIVAMMFGALSVYIAGSIFFKFTLALTSNSVMSWFTYLRNDEKITRYEKTFYDSCQHISLYIGPFFAAKNPALPLIFFGHYIMKATVDLLITFR